MPVGGKLVAAFDATADARLGVANRKTTPLGNRGLEGFVVVVLKDVAGLHETFDSFALTLFDKDDYSSGRPSG